MCIVVNSKLLLFTGKNFLNSIEYLDPVTGEWTNFTPKPEVLKNGSDNYTKENGYTKEGKGHDTESNEENSSDQEDNLEKETVTNGHHVTENGCNGLPIGIHPLAINGH